MARSLIGLRSRVLCVNFRLVGDHIIRSIEDHLSRKVDRHGMGKNVVNKREFTFLEEAEQLQQKNKT